MEGHLPDQVGGGLLVSPDRLTDISGSLIWKGTCQTRSVAGSVWPVQQARGTPARGWISDGTPAMLYKDDEDDIIVDINMRLQQARGTPARGRRCEMRMMPSTVVIGTGSGIGIDTLSIRGIINIFESKIDIFGVISMYIVPARGVLCPVVSQTCTCPRIIIIIIYLIILLYISKNCGE